MVSWYSDSDVSELKPPTLSKGDVFGNSKSAMILVWEIGGTERLSRRLVISIKSKKKVSTVFLCWEKVLFSVLQTHSSP